jgi:hypothetical protein
MGEHIHPWPVQGPDWAALTDCTICGLRLLRTLVDSASWVVRRVETVQFLDERTVRRHMRIDYASPPDAMYLARPHRRESFR